MKHSKKKRGTLLMTIGILLLAAALILTLYNIYDASRADQASQDVLSQLEQEIDENSDDSGNSVSKTGENTDGIPEDRDMPTIIIDGNQYIGYISVPSLGLSLPVMQDWDYSKLRISPCRYSGSVYTNDLVIAGHNYRRHFSALRYQEPGTEVVFTDAEGNVYNYVISDVEILSPTQVEDMVTASDDWDLTLFTCTTGGRTRFTVRCIRAD